MDRYYFLDSARAVLMILGIPYHAALVYSTVRWSVNSDQSYLLFSYFCGIVNSFRMPAFFIIAGFFSALILSRRSRESWIKQRIVRLGVPFLTGVLILVTIQNFFLSFIDSSFELFVSHFYGLMTSGAGHSIGHLWFLPPIIMMSIFLAISWGFFSKQKSLSFMKIKVTNTFFCLLLISIFIAAWKILIFNIGRTVPLSFFGNYFSLRNFLYYLPYFLIGLLVCVRLKLLEKFLRFNIFSATFGVVSSLSYSYLFSSQSTDYRHYLLILGAFSSIFMSQTVFSIFKIYFDRPSGASRYFSKNAFSIYLLHHPIIICVSAFLVNFRLSVFYQFIFICLVTFLFCVAFCFFIEKSNVLRFLFGSSAKKV